MTHFEALLYGAVQGVTEYLPISSSAHLILLPKFLGQQDPGLTFDVFLHFGTVMSTLIYFWRDWLGVAQSLPVVGSKFGKSVLPPGAPRVDWKLIAIATVPALIAGALLHNLVETVFRGNIVIVCTLILGGALLFLSDHLGKRSKNLAAMTTRTALSMGLFQCLALVPGMSRSGSTITGGRILGFDRASAAKFSFLMSGPVTAAALVFELRKWDQLFDGSIPFSALAVAGVSSFVFGMLAIGGLLKLIRHFGYLTFAVYRVVLAVVVWKTFGV